MIFSGLSSRVIYRSVFERDLDLEIFSTSYPKLWSPSVFLDFPYFGHSYRAEFQMFLKSLPLHEGDFLKNLFWGGRGDFDAFFHRCFVPVIFISLLYFFHGTLFQFLSYPGYFSYWLWFSYNIRQQKTIFTPGFIDF